MPVAIKICGLCDEAVVRAVAKAKAEYAGFVSFPTSPRHVSPTRAAELKNLLPASTEIVSVLVDPDDALLKELHATLQPHYFQLHGKESPSRLVEIKSVFPDVKIIKAITLQDTQDLAKISDYLNYADMLLFDAKPPANAILPGGNGAYFDWSLLTGQSIGLPWFLSGGLTKDNVAEAIMQTSASRVDISSGVETAPGKKSPALIQAFIETVRTL